MFTGVVAHHVGPPFARHASTVRRLAFAMMNSPEAMYAAGAGETRAACGRLVNAAVAAIGPDLDPGGTAFTSFAALVAAVRDGGENGSLGGGVSSGGVTDGFAPHAGPQTDDSGCQLEAALFLQQLGEFIFYFRMGN